MQEANFNKNLNLPKLGGNFLKLKAKGDKIKFRIASTPHYETKHWLAARETVMCAKFNSDDKKAVCVYCEKYQKLQDVGEKEEAKQMAPVTTFYYPILNLENNTPAIFQFTAKGIHYTIKGYADENVNVFGCDWSVERTEEPGNYYKILRLGNDELTPVQKEAYEAAKLIKLKAKESASVVLDEEISLPEE